VPRRSAWRKTSRELRYERLEAVPKSDERRWLNKTFRSNSSEENGGNKESGSYQDAKATADQRMSIFRRENADGRAGFVYKGSKAEGRKSERQGDQT
jgi:hypothetical protein